MLTGHRREGNSGYRVEMIRRGRGAAAIGLRFQRDRAFGRGCRCTGGETEGGEIVTVIIRACQVVPAEIPMCRGAGR